VHYYSAGSNRSAHPDVGHYDGRLSDPAFFADAGLARHGPAEASGRITVVMVASPWDPHVRRYLSSAADHNFSDHAIGPYRNVRANGSLGRHEIRTESDIRIDRRFAQSELIESRPEKVADLSRSKREGVRA